MTKNIANIVINLVALKAGVMRELLFNKPASGTYLSVNNVYRERERLVTSMKTKNDVIEREGRKLTALACHLTKK